MVFLEIPLSEAEQTFIVHGVEQNCRSDGRDALSYRPSCLESGVVSNTSGSAHFRIGNTDVLVGVKAEIETPLATAPNAGRAQFFVDCTANATPEFEGRGGEDLSRDISNSLTAAFHNHSTLDLESLCICPKHFCWVLFVDVVVLEYGGNLYDAVFLAVKAALNDVRMPKVSVMYNEQQEPELEMSDDPHDVWRIDTTNVPVAVTVSKIGVSNVVDLTVEEETCAKAQLILSVTPKGELTLVKQIGRGSLDLESLTEMISAGVAVGVELNVTLTQVLQREESVTKKISIGFLGFGR